MQALLLPKFGLHAATSNGNTYLTQPPDFEADQLCMVYATMATNSRPVIAELKDTWAQNDNTQEAA